MRYFAFHVEPPREPWVMAEGPDETWMRDLPHNVWFKAVVLSEAEAPLDPEFSPALAAWKAGDDSAYEGWDAIEVAEMALDDARVDAMRDGLIEQPEPWRGGPPFDSFVVDEAADPEAECDRLFQLIVGTCMNATFAFGEESARQLWRKVAYYCRDAAERDRHPRLV